MTGEKQRHARTGRLRGNVEEPLAVEIADRITDQGAGMTDRRSGITAVGISQSEIDAMLGWTE